MESINTCEFILNYNKIGIDTHGKFENMSAAICSCKLLCCLQNDYYESMYLLSEPMSIFYVLQYSSLTKVICSQQLYYLIYSGWYRHSKMFLHDSSCTSQLGCLCNGSFYSNTFKALQAHDSSAGDMWPYLNNTISQDCCNHVLSLNHVCHSLKTRNLIGLCKVCLPLQLVATERMYGC